MGMGILFVYACVLCICLVFSEFRKGYWVLESELELFVSYYVGDGNCVWVFCKNYYGF